MVLEFIYLLRKEIKVLFYANADDVVLMSKTIGGMSRTLSALNNIYG